ncbi:MAG: hypothetical protein IPK97_11430 [Ahniella sp.]|nr:hypothetical protein [Ahniella sp.]
MCAIPDPAALNARLRALFLNYEQGGDRYANPTPFVRRPGQSVRIALRPVFPGPDPEIIELRDFCWQNLFRAVAELNGHSRFMRQLKARASAWFHITRQGGFFGVHNHPMASWSGVYCVAESERAEQCGVLSFINPNSTNTMYVDHSLMRLRKPFSYGNQDYRLSPGELVLFPSWVLHEVLPFGGDGERITVAFNAQFTHDGPVAR